MVKFKRIKHGRYCVEGPLDEVYVGTVKAVRRDGTTEWVKVGSLGQPYARNEGGAWVRGYIEGNGARAETVWEHEVCPCCGDPGGVVIAFELAGPKGLVCLTCAKKEREELHFDYRNGTK